MPRRRNGRCPVLNAWPDRLKRRDEQAPVEKIACGYRSHAGLAGPIGRLSDLCCRHSRRRTEPVRVLASRAPERREPGYAALMLVRNASTSARRVSVSRRRASEALSTSAAELPAFAEASETPAMLLETSVVPAAAAWMLRAISRVAAPCCSTAAAIAVVTSLISPMVPPMLRIADTAEEATCCMPAIWVRISPVALAVWLARLFASCATTATP